MRRLWCVKYALTLLTLTAVTFHILYSRVDVVDQNENHVQDDHTNKNVISRLWSPDNRVSPPARWVVLPGNVTVHEGQELYPLEVDFVFRAENVCEDFEESRSKLLIFISSSGDHFSKRQAIRETWGLRALQLAHNYRIVFILGMSDGPLVQNQIVSEAYRYGDLVQINATEVFQNLGLKSAVGLRWSRDLCPGADFIMKTDDDILVHIGNLLGSLANAEQSKNLLLCHQNRLRKILRSHQSMPDHYDKYVVPEEELPGIYYPPYCSGMAYVFSRTVRDRLFEASLTTPVFFIEDVYLTGFCRHKAGVAITTHPGITLRPPVDVHQASCSFRDGRVTSQEVEADVLRKLWAELNTQGFFCPRLLGRLERPAVDKTQN